LRLQGEVHHQNFCCITVVYSGQVYAPGNAYNDAGEFNWWFDPEAAQAVLRAEVPKFIVPLDCTNTVPLTKETYLKIANHEPSTSVTELYKDNFAPFFGSAPPPYVPYIYDTIALGFLVNPSFATDIRDVWLDIDTVTPIANTTFGSNYGKTTPYTSDPYPATGILSKSRVVFTIDTPAFLTFYIDLLTRPRSGKVSARVRRKVERLAVDGRVNRMGRYTAQTSFARLVL
jgi:purine nucleosidase